MLLSIMKGLLMCGHLESQIQAQVACKHHKGPLNVCIQPLFVNFLRFAMHKISSVCSHLKKKSMGRVSAL